MTELNERGGLLHGVAHRFGDYLPLDQREAVPGYQRDDFAETAEAAAQGETPVPVQPAAILES